MGRVGHLSLQIQTEPSEILNTIVLDTTITMDGNTNFNMGMLPGVGGMGGMMGGVGGGDHNTMGSGAGKKAVHVKVRRAYLELLGIVVIGGGGSTTY